MTIALRHLVLISYFALSSALFVTTKIALAQEANAADGAPMADQDAAGGENEPKETSKPRPESPAVSALRNTTSDDPSVLLKNVFTLIDLGAPEAARPLVEKLSAAGLDSGQQAALARQFGTGQLFRLMRIEELAPEGKQLAQSLFDASVAAARDPAKLTEWIAQLEDPARARQAAVELRRAGVDGAAFCLSALSDPNQAPHHKSLASVLATFGQSAKEPLLAALESEDLEFRARVMSALTQMSALANKTPGRPLVMRAVPHLVADALNANSEAPTTAAAQRALKIILGEVPSRADAETLLMREIRRGLRDRAPLPIDYTDQVELWRWDDSAKKATAEKRTPKEAGAVIAARLARDLIELNSDQREHKRLFILAALEADKIRHGYDQPLVKGPQTAREFAKDTTAEELVHVLNDALEAQLPGAALGALELIAERGGPSLLVTSDGSLSPIMQALDRGDRRVRFEALRTIMLLDPRSGFPGASRVPTTLGYFVSTTGTPYTVLGDSRAARATTLAARLAAAGAEVLTANNGMALIALANRSADVEMILIDMEIRRPRVREVLFRLRRDPATSHLPFALIASPAELPRARRLAANNPLTHAALRPLNEESSARLLQKLRALNPRGHITPEQRREQTIQALAWLAELSGKKETIYDLGHLSAAAEATLGVRDLAKHAAPTVAALGRPSGQRALARLAGRPTSSEEDRRAAADAFQQAVKQHGLLLTTQEIAQQYENYNASESADAATQQILASILDTIESKTKKPKSE